MRKLIANVRIALLLSAIALSAATLFPNAANAVKSCEYYCGPAGPTVCTCSPVGIHCTWDLN